MTARTVTTQAELDQALSDQVDQVTIDSPAGVWLMLGDDGRPAIGSSHVVARESSHVVAWGSSHVEAWESSHVEAWESSHVVAWGSSHVVARESSHVEARESSHVEAGKYVAVHLRSTDVNLTGGVVIDLTTLDLDNPAIWCDYHGATVTDGQATLYKAVDADLDTGHNYLRTRYPIGQIVAATDWAPDRECGHGLHFSPSPMAAFGYYTVDGEPRFLAMQVAVDEMVCLGEKVKAPACRVLHEVDVHGDRLPEPVEVTG
ncbi:MAG: DUF7666 domain-containing protein [Acidimicrobiales bacterium]